MICPDCKKEMELFNEWEADLINPAMYLWFCDKCKTTYKVTEGEKLKKESETLNLF
jgi:uncharacterized protein YbaR (Trm112 family)